MRRLAFGILCLLVATAAAAQEVAGSVDGIIVGPDSAALVDVEILLSGSGLPGTLVATSDARGRFRFPRVPVGMYRLQLRRIGFRPASVTEVPVRLGTNTSLPRLSLAATNVVLEAIVVTAESAGVELTTTADATTLPAEHLDALPLQRNYRDISLLAPAAVPSFLGNATNLDGVNIAGSTGPENNFYVDGINVTSPIRGETSIDLPYNFVRDIEVRVGGAAAEDAQALGGVINVVTPSGSNRFSGQGFGFFASDATQTDPRRPAGAVPATFRFYDAGLTLSGPVVRNRVWYYGAYSANYERRQDRFPFGTVLDERRQHLFAGKLTWQAGPRTLASATILGDPSRDRPAVFPLFATGTPQNAEVLQRTGRTRTLAGSLRLQHALNARVQLEASLSTMSRLEVAQPATADGWAPYVSDQINNTLSGGHGLAERLDAYRRTATMSLAWRAALHDIKVGAGYELVVNTMDLDAARSGGGGEIVRLDTALYSWHWFRVAGGSGGNRNPSVFAQDAWRVADGITLQAGLRWSRQLLTDAVADTVVLRVRDGLQPRVGVIIDVGPARGRLIAGYARVADQLSLWNAQGYGVGAESVMVFQQNPRVDTTGGTIVYAAANLAARGGTVRGQTSNEWHIGYNWRLGRSIRGAVRLMRRSLRDAVQTGLPLNQVWGNVGYGALDILPRPKRVYDALEVTLERVAGNGWWRASYVLSRNYGNYPGLYLSDWRIAVPHTGPGYWFPEQFTNAEGLLPNDRTHLLKAFGAATRGRLGLGATLLVASGTPLSEYGGLAIGPPFRGFASPRGTAGRTPWIWDLGIRASCDLPLRAALRSRLLLDIQHVASPRRAVDYDQLHYSCLDSSGQQACENPSYGTVTQYQPPMTARLGLTVGW